MNYGRTFDNLPFEIMARVVEAACCAPRSVKHVSLVSNRYASAIETYGDRIWGLSLERLRWPPSSHALRGSYLTALRRVGHHCKRLEVSFCKSGPTEIAKVAELCPMITSLHLDGIGSDGLNEKVWFGSLSSLRELELGFRYYNDEGRPALRDVLHQIADHCGPRLRRLNVTGLDYFGADIALYNALASRMECFGALRLLHLRCSEELGALDDGALEALRAGMPNCVIVVSTFPA
jgi:hypothetical protein